MKFDAPAGTNPIDRLRVVGHPIPRVDAPLKATGTAPYAYDRHGVIAGQAYGVMVSAGIAKGSISSIDATRARAAPGVIAVVTTLDYPNALPLGQNNTAHLFGGAAVQHYHQAVAVVVAETFEQATAAAAMVRPVYERTAGAFNLAKAAPAAPLVPGTSGEGSQSPAKDVYGDPKAAFLAAPFKIDRTYNTPYQSHAMMEPHASIAAWNGDRLRVWTSNQSIANNVAELAATLSLGAANVRVESPYIGGGFGGKLFLRADAVLAAIGAKAANRPVRLALTRPVIFNNTTHRSATVQRIRLAADRDGKLVSIYHESASANLLGGRPEASTEQTRLLYGSPNRETYMRLAEIDLPEANSMRAPGEASGLMALEIAMDEMAEAVGIDPVELRIRNDTQVDPEHPGRRFSERHLVECLKLGAERFGWASRPPKPASRREREWLIGYGVASGFRNNLNVASAARVTLRRDGRLLVETDMTDLGTGSYTVIGQTAAEMLGLPFDAVTVELGDSAFPKSCGSGGQYGANNSTSGVYAACVKLREAVAAKLGINAPDVLFADGHVSAGGAAHRLVDAARDGPIVGEDGIVYGGTADQPEAAGPGARRKDYVDLEDYQQSTFAAHFVEVAVHADIPHQDVIFLDEVDPISSPMKAKGVGEIGLCGVAAAVANAIYNATGVRVHDYPITLDKLTGAMPAVA